MSKTRTILTPGEVEAQDDTQSPVAADPASELEALRAEVARLRAAAGPKQPGIIYEPKTPHGAARLAESAYASMTVAELMAAIDSGKASELPHTQSALCSDGYYVSRARVPA